MTRITKKKIQSVLRESDFDPRSVARTPLTVVVSLDDPGYSEMKAVELIHEARTIQKEVVAGYRRDTPESQKEYHDKVTMAISLLALARSQRGTPEGKAKTRKKDSGCPDNVPHP